MTIDHRFIIRQLQTISEIYAAFSPVTKMPFVICDKESFNDQIHIFTEESLLQEFSKPYIEQKNFLSAVKVKKEQFLQFYGSLYNIGINTVVLHDKTAVTELALEEIVRRRQDTEKLPPEKQPLLNPELMLTALYFMQEMRRPVPQQEKQGLAELDEELVANLVRGRFLSGIETNASASEENSNNFRIPYIKNNKDELYQVIFTDGTEFHKFDQQQKLRPVVITFDDLPKFLLKDARGYILNPQSIALPLQREQLPAFKKRIHG